MLDIARGDEDVQLVGVCLEVGHAAGQYLTDLFWFFFHAPPVLVALLAGDKAVDLGGAGGPGGLGLGQLIHADRRY